MPSSDAKPALAATARLSLSSILRSPIVDSKGERLGRVDDVIARFAEGGYPPMTGLVGKIAGRKLFIPRSLIASIEPGRVQLAGETLNLARFERRQGEVLLNEDVLGRRLISVEQGRLVTARDLALAFVDPTWHVAGVDTRGRGPLGRFRDRSKDNGTRGFIDWSGVEPFVGHVPTSRLLMPLMRLRRLHPAQIADLVESASHEEGEEIISAVHADPELEADVFEELDTEHQLEFLRSRSDAEVASVLAGMAPDDAADLITELEQDRRVSVLKLLPPAKQAKVRALLNYNPDSAGGLMSPDFVSVPHDATVAEALSAVRTTNAPTQAASDVFLAEDGRLVGAVSLLRLVRSGDGERVQELVERGAISVQTDDDFPEVALRMADFNLTVLPVVDDNDRIIGVITVDDVLEQMLPDSWRRRAEADRDREEE
jgi:CBS domain-containing protein/sporulation protein YlmC with PRC-barrel domain